eukprot:SAG31_NODE_43394_length_267_cov_0.702381_1_plen_28_part_01
MSSLCVWGGGASRQDAPAGASGPSLTVA